MTLPLAGVRVLDFSRLLPGGYCTQLLADMGADVVKIETPRVGDYARIAPEVFGGDAIFKATNRGKRSLALNFRSQKGRAVVMRLVEKADVVFEMFRPGMMGRWGLGYEVLQSANPRLIYCALTGYGQTGPYRDRSGHDLNYVAISGLLDFNGPPEGEPVPMAAQIADMSGGMMAALSIASSLYGRASSGEGAFLDLSMLDMAVSWSGPIVGALYFAGGDNPARGRGPLSGELPCYSVYETKDHHYVTVANIEPLLWTTFCKALERDDLYGRQYDPTAVPEVAAEFKQRDLHEWQALFDGLEVCFEPVIPFSSTLDHPQVLARGLVIESEDGGQVEGVRATSWDESSGVRRPPDLGEHTRQVLEDFDFDAQEIDQLIKERTAHPARTRPD